MHRSTTRKGDLWNIWMQMTRNGLKCGKNCLLIGSIKVIRCASIVASAGNILAPPKTTIRFSTRTTPFPNAPSTSISSATRPASIGASTPEKIIYLSKQFIEYPGRCRDFLFFIEQLRQFHYIQSTFDPKREILDSRIRHFTFIFSGVF